MKEQPLHNVVWRDRNSLKANSYNPNKVAPPELRLLKLSILEDGWTQPIVINSDMIIVDGFHRWSVSADPEVFALTGGLVPTVQLAEKGLSALQMATIRHNRARGTHGVLAMSDIVTEMVEAGLSGDVIMVKLGMERDEVARLLYKAGIPQSKVFKEATFSKSWEPK